MNFRTQKRSRRSNRDESKVLFPVTPMLDMAFQLLAFFILSFQAPTRETRLDLYLPSEPQAVLKSESAKATAADSEPGTNNLAIDLETELVVHARSDDLGDLKTLLLGDVSLENVDVLSERLSRYREVLRDKPLRVVLYADDSLRYQAAAQILAACTRARVETVRLADAQSQGNPR